MQYRHLLEALGGTVAMSPEERAALSGVEPGPPMGRVAGLATAAALVLLTAAGCSMFGSHATPGPDGWIHFDSAEQLDGARVVTIDGHYDVSQGTCVMDRPLTMDDATGGAPPEAIEVAFNPTTCQWKVEEGRQP